MSRVVIFVAGTGTGLVGGGVYGAVFAVSGRVFIGTTRVFVSRTFGGSSPFGALPSAAALGCEASAGLRVVLAGLGEEELRNSSARPKASRNATRGMIYLNSFEPCPPAAWLPAPRRSAPRLPAPAPAQSSTSWARACRITSAEATSRCRLRLILGRPACQP